ncbi:MAG: hypothetical protein PHF21_04655 [Bacilli bacterium]|nr:hypothetical protein [Bacilli bacterium]
MVEYTLLDKIKTVYNLIVDSPLFLILLLGIILMILDILFISKQDKKTKITYTITSLILIIFFMNSYLESLLQIFDTIAKNIVAIIYFPSVLEYILVLLISIIILFVSIINKKIKKIIKHINIFVLIINSFLFFLILDELAITNVDLTNKISIYTNSNLMMLLELSIIIFIIWIVGLILYKTIKTLSPKKSDEKAVNLEVDTFYSEPVVPNNLKELKKPNSKIEYVVIEKQKEEDMFTLEEYRQMKALLEVIKSKK